MEPSRARGPSRGPLPHAGFATEGTRIVSPRLAREALSAPQGHMAWQGSGLFPPLSPLVPQVMGSGFSLGFLSYWNTYLRKPNTMPLRETVSHGLSSPTTFAVRKYTKEGACGGVTASSIAQNPLLDTRGSYRVALLLASSWT